MTGVEVGERAPAQLTSSAPAAVLEALPPFLVGLHELFDEPHVVGSLLVLGVLDRRGPLRAAELAAAIRLAPSTLSRKLAYLQGRGWVSTSTPPEDARGIVVQLTGDGELHLSALREQLTARLQSALGTWSEDDLRTFARYLDRCCERSRPTTKTAAPRQGRTPVRGDR